MHEIQFAPEAISDLQEIKQYITEELCNEAAAVHTVTKILGRIGTLADFPQIGAPLSSVLDVETDYRFLVCGHYTAFYRVEAEAVRVIRVLYGRRNFMQILFGEPKED